MTCAKIYDATHTQKHERNCEPSLHRFRWLWHLLSCPAVWRGATAGLYRDLRNKW